MDAQTPLSSPASVSTPPPPVAAAEDKTPAILSYLTLIGFVVAIILHSNKKTKLGAFHLRQVLGLILTGVAAGFCYIILIFIPIIGWLAILGIWIGLLALWVMGLIAAINGQMKPMPVLGPYYQKWFGTTFE
jgi:uncharacterized membrane protein